MSEKFYFPFGQELKKVQQKDRSPKKAFVLGVYASAVHARWIDKDGKQLVSALAVASEPEIFWRGDNADEIISKIKIPEELGKLTVPKASNLNGPSGRALDNLYLDPLCLNRNSVWLCDLLPESRVNEQQRKAIRKHYTEKIIQQYNLIPASIPDFNKTDLNNVTRREEILQELELSGAETLILLGDLPIYWFLRFHDKSFSRLSDFTKREDGYGMSQSIKINNKIYQVFALCHPRQADRLGKSSLIWGKYHDSWINRVVKLA